MQALLKGDIDAAQAMIYNEYAQVLEAKNPATGQLYQPSDFGVINWEQVGSGMLQDRFTVAVPPGQVEAVTNRPVGAGHGEMETAAVAGCPFTACTEYWCCPGDRI